MADNRKLVQAQKTTLSGSGVSATATSIVLQNLKHLTVSGGGNIVMSDFGTKGFGTIEPGTSREEVISFEGISQNGDGTATLTTVTRNLKPYYPYDQYSSTGFAHAGGATFIVTNNPQVYDSFANKENDETINGLWDFANSIPTIPTTTPTTDDQIASKLYVDDQNDLDVHLTGDQTIAGNKTFTGTTDLQGDVDIDGNLTLEEIAAYDSHPTFTADEQLIDKKYADDLAIAGSPDASTTVKGIVEEATNAEIQAGTGAGDTGARLFVNPTQVATSGANKILLLDSSGKIDTSALPGLKFGGDGSDGVLNVTSGTTSIDAGGQNIVLKQYSSINISAGATVNISNPASDGTILLLRSSGDVTIAGTLDLSMAGGAGGTGGAAATSDNTNGATGTDGTKGFSMWVTQVNNGLGGTGSSNAGAAPSAPSANDDNVFTIISSYKVFRKDTIVACGSGGGGGGGARKGSSAATGSAGGDGGRGGGGLILECYGALDFSGTISVSGSAGSAGGAATGGSLTVTSGGGGGGGSAGMALVLYNTLTANTGTLSASGGAGGAGGSTTGGASGTPGNGGGGGSGASSILAAGGAGGAGGTSNSGANSPGSSGSNAGGAGAGGGGGGGAAQDTGTPISGAAGGTGGSSVTMLIQKNTEYF